jgi:septal ring factor EnvC (AmiA/AmiB activator)
MLSLSANAAFKDPEAIRDALETNQKNLDNIRRLTDQLENTYSKTQQQLKSSEQAIAATQQQSQVIQQQQQELQQQILELEQKTAELENRKLSQQQLLNNELKLLYQKGTHDAAKQWLSQQDPEKLQRLNYYHYQLQQARLQKLQAYKQTLNEQASAQAHLLTAQQALTDSHAALLAQQQVLTQQRQQRQTLIKQIQQQSQQNQHQLSQLQNEQNDLQNLLEQLLNARQQAEQKRKAAQRLLSKQSPLQQNEQTKNDDHGAPNPLKGKLPWPTKGKVIANYGSKRDGLDLSWKGIFIDAPEGNKVLAVESGEIIFANWLRGYGLLCIIDHGDGILSLYGHNKVITRKLGEQVKANEVIAEVGNSGGLEQSGLYFEIRQQGRAINPLAWLKK